MNIIIIIIVIIYFSFVCIWPSVAWFSSVIALCIRTILSCDDVDKDDDDDDDWRKMLHQKWPTFTCHRVDIDDDDLDSPFRPVVFSALSQEHGALLIDGICNNAI